MSTRQWLAAQSSWKLSVPGESARHAAGGEEAEST